MKNFFMIAANQVIQIINNPDSVKELVPCSEIVIAAMEPVYEFNVSSNEEQFQIGKRINSETYRFVCNSEDIKQIINRLQLELEIIEKLEK